MPPKKSKIKARRAALREPPPVSQHRRNRWRNLETGLVREFWPAPKRGQWVRVPWPVYL